MKNFAVVWACIALFFGVGLEPLAASEKPLVAASIEPLALLVRDVAGERVDVRTLLSANASPHDFALTIGQAMALRDASLLIWVGPALEGFLTDTPKPRHLAMDDERVHEDQDHHPTHGDVHLWLQPEAVSAFLVALHGALKTVLPAAEHAALDSRVASVSAAVDAQWQASKLALAPYRTRTFISYHDGVSHLIQALALKQNFALTQVPHERISARRLQRAHEAASEASCLLAETGEQAEARRYAKILDLPLIEVDILATRGGYASYAVFIAALSDALKNCLQRENVQAEK